MELKPLVIFCCTISICFGGERFHLPSGQCSGCCTVWPGPAIGKPCIFPFSWQGKTYRRCAYEPATGDEFPWCSTKVDGNGNHVAGQRQWGKCNKACSQATTKPPSPVPVSCKCPSAGVEGGYMEYNQIKQKLADLEETNSALIEEMAALKSKVADNEDALENKCDVNQCTAIKTDVDLVESCIADKSSNNCPSAAAGKVSITDAIKALETPSVFNCLFTNGDVDTTLEVLSPYSCDVNDGNVVDESSGKFIVPKAGIYRLTFMALNFPLNKKKVISVLVKTSSGVESKIARSVAQSMIGDEEEQLTTTIDIIHKLQVGDTIHVSIQVKSGPKISGQVDTGKAQQVTFTGEFIRE